MRILYVEDNPGDAVLLRHEFSDMAPHIQIEWAATCSEAIDKLSVCVNETPIYDLVLTDMQLPDGRGVSLLPYLQEHGLNIPLVVITGFQDQFSAVSSIKAGAIDYVVKKEGYLKDLPRTLDAALMRYRTETARKANRINVLYASANRTEIDATLRHFNLYAPFIRLNSVSTASAVLNRLEKLSSGRPGTKNDSIDVVLIDESVDMLILDLLKEIRIIRRIQIPIVLMSDESQYELAMQALRIGADDYLVKSSGYLYSLPISIENAFNRARVEAEKQALQKSQEYYRMLLENVSDMIVVSNASGIVTYCSPSVQRTLGYMSDQSLGANVLEKIYPGDRSSVFDQYHSCFQNLGMIVGPLEFRYRHADGTWRWIEALGMATFEPSGEPLVVSVARDITQRIAAQEALYNSEARLSEAVKMARIAYWELDPLARRFIFNDAFYDFFGTTVEMEGGYQMTIDQYRDRYVSSDDWQRFNQVTAEILADPCTFRQFEHRIIRRDGEIRHLLTRVQCGQNASGDLVRAFGTSQDITDRIKMGAALQQSESQYRSLVENPVIGIFIAQDQIIRYANKRCCELLGFDAEEIIDTLNFMQLLDPEDRNHFKEAARVFNEKQTPIEEEVRITRKDGKVIVAKVFANAITYQGKLAAAGILIDKTLETSLENQLRQSQKMEAIGTLAGGIAHDFNNILTALTGYGSLLKMEMESGRPARMAYVEAILSSSLKASNLTQGLLAFARQQVTTLKPIELNECVSGIKKMLGRLLTEDITLRLDLCQENTVVMADVGQIDQIIINLAVNARDAMTNGGCLSIETRSVNLSRTDADIYGLEGAGRFIELSVSDTGMGMEEAIKERIFEPFYTTKEPGKGTGLGLATVYGIVKKHNGGISVYSEKGQGTIFRIYLPAIDALTEEQPNSMASMIGGTETILLAEDDESVRESIAALLERFGYTVLQAVDGANALELFKENVSQIDILLFDSVMPKKNGRQAYDEIHQIEPDIKVIFMSGYTRDVVLDKGVEEKRFDFLSKPVSHDVLLGKLREVLNR